MISLARSVGKLIATVWLDDSPVLDTLFTEVVDFGASGFERAVETRKTERFFEDCADQVLSRCTSFFDGEFRKVEERRRATILEEISRVCSEYVTTEKLINEKYSGDQLAEELLSKLTLVDMKDQTEKWFVETVLEKVCFYVCEYKHLAPDFQLLSTRHILDNTDQILEILSVVVDRVSPNQGDQTQVHSRYLRYKSRLRKRIQNIEIFGLSTQSVKSQYPLETSYISLSVGADAWDHEIVDDYFGTRVEDYILEGRHHWLFGSAGFGKSTLLQWLCLQSASEEPDIKLSWLSDYAPALIKLRSLESFKGLSFFDAVRQTYPHVVSDEDEPWLNDLAHDGRIVFMVDGFDEVPPKQRASAKRWLSELIDEFSHCTFIVTSRPIPQSTEPHGFRTAYLEKMRPDDVSRFIRFWHNAVATGIRDEFFVQRLYSLSEKLQDAVQSVPALRTLASNPLMCALLCTINCDRRGNIPLDKSDIYRVAVELMLDRRNYERGIENEIYDAIGKKNVRAILQEISRWMVLNGLSEIKRSKFAVSMRSLLKCGEKEEIDTRVSSLVERSGLLLEVPPRDIVFIHNQFKEFLAAESFIIENDIGLLKKNSQDVTWTEMLPLACGIMNRGQADDFINYLADNVPEKTDTTYRSRCFQLVSLAYHCPRLDSKTIDQVDAFAKSVLPPENVDEVFGILHLGAKLVELIASSSSAGKMSDQVAAMCIRALMEVGDGSVVPLIASINAGAGKLASQAAITAWDYFSSEKYGELVVSSIEHGYEIAWDYRTDLTGLRFAHRATAITLDNCVFDGDLCILPTLNSCKRFALHSPDGLDSLEGLQSFSTLEELTISGLEEVRSFEFLCGLNKLRVLKLENCPALRDLKFLNSLDSLESLSIVGCFNLESIVGVERQDNLEELDLTGAFGIRDWSPLNKIHHTVEVSCEDSGFVYDQLSDEAKERIYLN